MGRDSYDNFMQRNTIAKEWQRYVAAALVDNPLLAEPGTQLAVRRWFMAGILTAIKLVYANRVGYDQLMAEINEIEANDAIAEGKEPH